MTHSTDHSHHPKLKALHRRSRVTICLLITLGVVFAVRMAVSSPLTHEDIVVRAVLMSSLVVAWSSWLFRAYGNLNEVFDFETTRSKTIAVLVHFIPIVNIFKPYSVFEEIWDRVAPATRRRERALLRGWWGGWLLCWLYFRYNSALSAAMPDPVTQALLTALDIGLFPTVCVLAARVVWSITAFQIARLQNQEVVRSFE